MLKHKSIHSRLFFFLISQALFALVVVAVAFAASREPSPQGQVAPAPPALLSEASPAPAPLSEASPAPAPERNAALAPLQATELTTLEVGILSSPWATLDHNDPGGSGGQVPQVFVVEAVVTNTGNISASEVIIDLDYELPGTGWVLLGDENRQRTVDTILPGKAHYVYWFARYPLNIGASHRYTVTADAYNTSAPVSTSDNYYGNPESGMTVKTRPALSTGNSGVSQVTADIIVGVAFTVTVNYDLGTDPRELTFSPVGNPDFDPSAYHLLGAKVRFYNDAGTQQQIVPDQLYFPTGQVPAIANNAEAIYTFIGLTPSNTRLCSYTTIGYKSRTKYDQFYCSEKESTVIPITGTLSLSLTKEAMPSPIQQNQYLTYTLRYTNTGSLPLSYVWIWDDVDSTIGSIVSPSINPPADTITDSRVAWYLGSVGVSGQPTSTGSLTFQFLVSGQGQGLDDNTPLVNRALFGINTGSLPQEAALTQTITTYIQAPDIDVVKSDGQAVVEPGDPLTYTLRITNSGSISATGLVITDVLPADVSYVPGTAQPSESSITGQTLVWEDLGPIPPGGGAVVIQIPVTVGPQVPNGTPLTNRAWVRYENPAGWRFALKTAQDTTTVNGPVLAISKSANPDPVLSGRLLTYTLTYANNGPGTASNVRITDVVPLSTTYQTCGGVPTCGVSDGLVSWTIGTVPASGGGSVNFSVHVSDTLDTGTLIRNEDYGIIADQLAYSAGPPLTTRVNRDAGFIQGYTFVDADSNGSYGPGDQPLAGVTVTLSSATVPLTYTDSTGYYRFRVETEEPISVTAGLPTGYFRTTASSVYTDNVLGITQTIDFGYAPVDSSFGVIYGTVYADANHNRQQDLGENGLSGVEINSAEAATPTVFTNKYGGYTLRYDSPGSVTITETNPPYYVSTTPDAVDAEAEFGSSNGSPIDFGDFLGIKISGQVFEDPDVDGVKDAVEEGLAGAIVAADGDSQTTGSTGIYTLYVTLDDTNPVLIEETDPGDYLSTNAIPGSGMSKVDANTLRIATPVSGTVYAGGDFGDVLASEAITISGRVWNDNGAGGGGLANGLPGGTEPGLAGAVVSLSSGLTQTTLANGLYSLYAPVDQAITVTETNPAGYVSTNAIPGDNAAKIDNDTLLVTALSGGSTSTGNLFGDVLASSVAIITGTVFDDQDESGDLNPGEPGLPGVTVTLEFENGNTIALLTGADGQYQFAVAPGTDVRITSSGPGGAYYATTLESVNLRPPAAGLYPDRNFGYSDDTDVAVIFGLVYDDLDSGGDLDFGEPGLAGARVTLDAGPFITTTGDGLVTGTFRFTVTETGVHTVHEDNPPGYRSTTLDDINVPVPTLGASHYVEFGDTNNPNTASIFGAVFDDVDGNGLQGPTELGLSGVVISVTFGSEVLATTTADYGQYSYRFDVGEAGSYTVIEQDPALPGYHSTTVDEVNLEVKLGNSYVVNFGDTEELFANILGVVFDDDSGEGDQDPGELGIAGVTVTLSTGETTNTGQYGGYTFRRDATGSLLVIETDPPGYHSTTPNTVPVNVDSLDKSYVVNFGDSNDPNAASFFGTVFNDQNVNGVWDWALGEPSLPGVKVTVVGPSDPPLAPYYTNPLGQFTFLLEETGIYTVTETDPAGYVSTIAIPGSAAVTWVDDNNLRVEVTGLGVDLGNNLFGDVLASQAVTISGTVWDDNGIGGGTAGDGVRNGAEPGLAGARLTLSSGLARTTAAGGAFLLHAPAGQPVTLTETNPPDYVSTDAIPGNGAAKVGVDTLSFSGLLGGSTSSGNLFGDVLPADLAVTKSGDPVTVVAGTTLTYTLVYSNVGPSYAQDATLVDTLPTGVTFGGVVSQPALLYGPTQTLQVLTWRDPSLAADAGGTIVFTATVQPELATGTTLVNGVSVASNHPDTATEDNSDEERTGVSRRADLAVTKAAEPDPVAAGATLTYSLSYSNDGPSDAQDAYIVDTLDTNVTFGGVVSQPLPWTGPAIDSNGVTTLTWNAITLPAGAAGTIVFSVTVKANTFGETTNAVEIASSTADDETGNNRDDLTTTVGDPFLATIFGYTYADANCNGTWDAGEPPIPGFQITLDGTETKTTLEDGAYWFITAEAGVHAVSKLPQEGYFSTTPEQVHVDVTLGRSYRVNFGSAPETAECAAIYGTVFNDADSDGAWGIDEVGITGVTISLDGATTKTTGPYGGYTFPTIEEITHTVIETDLPGYLSTTDNKVEVEVALGNGYQVDFGDVLSAACTCLGDEFEPDDGQPQAKELAVGLKQSRNFCDDASDWIQFQARPGFIYTITTSAGGPDWYWGRRADTDLALYDASGRLLATNDDYEGSEDYSSQIVWWAPVSAEGTHYLHVTNRAGLFGCLTDYEIWMEQFESYFLFLPIVTRDYTAPAPAAPEQAVAPAIAEEEAQTEQEEAQADAEQVESVRAPEGVINHACPDAYEVDDTYEQAGPIGDGDLQVHSFDSDPALWSADKDLVWFDIWGRQTITFTATPFNGVDTLLEIHDGLSAEPIATGTLELVWTAERAGTYYLTASPRTGTYSCAETYTLQAEISPQWRLYVPVVVRSYPTP